MLQEELDAMPDGHLLSGADTQNSNMSRDQCHASVSERRDCLKSLAFYEVNSREFHIP